MGENADQPLYEVGDTAFVPYEGGKHYTAKIIKKELRQYSLPDGTSRPMWYYLVHYVGWNKKYDEWVEQTGCRKTNPDADGSNKKQRLSHTSRVSDRSRPKISLAIPPGLKQKLVEDHDAVKKEGKLLPVPRTPCVEEVLASYVKSRPKKATADTDAQQLLLYAEERKQADEFIGNGTLPSSVYGAEHLLRLFVKLPEYLPVEGSTEDQYRLLQSKLHEVLDFLQSKTTEYFVPTAEYISPMLE